MSISKLPVSLSSSILPLSLSSPLGSDFGLAKSTDENGGLKTYCGTPQYFAPEILSQENSDANLTYSLSSDMWSVGVITFALLSGRLPWSDDDRLRNTEILKAKYSFNGEPWGDISEEAKDFISHLIKKKPGDRLTAQQAVAHPWFEGLSHLRDHYLIKGDGSSGGGKKGTKKASGLLLSQSLSLDSLDQQVLSLQLLCQ
jgi:serine/threonine protein kinase